METLDLNDHAARQAKLEALIDKHGFLTVLNDLAFILRAKADHLRTNWQDENSAKYWDKDAKRIESIIEKHN